MVLNSPSLISLVLPLALDFDGVAVRENSLAITSFVQGALHQPGPMSGWPKYLIDQVADNNDTVEVLSKAFGFPSIAEDPDVTESFLYCLNFVYTDQLHLLSECEKLLAAA